MNELEVPDEARVAWRAVPGLLDGEDTVIRAIAEPVVAAVLERLLDRSMEDDTATEVRVRIFRELERVNGVDR